MSQPDLSRKDSSRCPLPMRVVEFRPTRSSGFSSRSTRPRRRVWALDWPSAARSSPPTQESYGLPTTLSEGLAFISHFQLRLQEPHMNNSDSNVYVVDDDPPVLQAVSRLLRSAGFQVTGYSSARRFLDRH